jgi:hypothetical protein
MRKPLLLATLFALTLAAAAGAGDDDGVDAAAKALGFSEGLRPLDVGALPGKLKNLSYRSCAKCHRAEATQWRRSFHAASLTDPIFQEGWSVEPRQRCIHCHAPLREQQRELIAVTVRKDDRARHDLSRLGDEALAREGVTCVVCHVRKGKLLIPEGKGPNVARDKVHDVVIEPALKSGNICAGCHEFRFEQAHEGTLALTDQPTQTTASEWRAYRAAGGEETCVSCHMNAGDHTFRGAHDDNLLASSLEVRAIATPAGGRMELRSVGVGHQLPTGDLYRHLVVEVAPEDGGAFERIAWIGRRFEVVTPEGAAPFKRLASNTSLATGETRVICRARSCPSTTSCASCGAASLARARRAGPPRRSLRARRRDAAAPRACRHPSSPRR